MRAYWEMSSGTKSWAGRPTNRRKKPYKIVLENVTQEKKKLQSIISYNDHAPPGHTFVPIGTPDLTEKCKELCRNKGLAVHIVSAAPKNKAHANPEKISHHTHRIGYHFPNNVVDKACDWLGYGIRGGQYTKTFDALSTRRLATRLGLDARDTNAEQSSGQIRAAIKDLFPLIPETDLEAIVKHAFREGTKRVGNAADLPLPRRVQLAVVAHIRHVYTDYDKLLRTGSYIHARSRVEQHCLEHLMKWRGEDVKEDIELEEIFREVIVIDDDEDEVKEVGHKIIVNDDDNGASAQLNGRSPSLEFISSQARRQDLEPDDTYVGHVTGENSHRYSLRADEIRTQRPKRLSLAQKRSYASFQEERPSSFPSIGYPKSPEFDRVMCVPETEGTIERERLGERYSQRVIHYPPPSNREREPKLRSPDTFHLAQPEMPSPGYGSDMRNQRSLRTEVFSSQTRYLEERPEAQMRRRSDPNLLSEHGLGPRALPAADREDVVLSIEGSPFSRAAPQFEGLNLSVPDNTVDLRQFAPLEHHFRHSVVRPQPTVAPEAMDYLVDETGRIVGTIAKQPARSFQSRYGDTYISRDEHGEDDVSASQAYTEATFAANQTRSKPQRRQLCRYDNLVDETRQTSYRGPEMLQYYDDHYDGRRTHSQRTLHHAHFGDLVDIPLRPPAYRHIPPDLVVDDRDLIHPNHNNQQYRPQSSQHMPANSALRDDTQGDVHDSFNGDMVTTRYEHSHESSTLKDRPTTGRVPVARLQTERPSPHDRSFTARPNLTLGNRAVDAQTATRSINEPHLHSMSGQIFDASHPPIDRRPVDPNFNSMMKRQQRSTDAPSPQRREANENQQTHPDIPTSGGWQRGSRGWQGASQEDARELLRRLREKDTTRPW